MREKTGKSMQCERCGKEKYVPLYRQKIFRFCSMECHIYDLSIKQQGQGHPRYKNGCITKYGYRLIRHNGEQIYEHRKIMEEYLGRKLLPFPKEIVHHINGKKDDNRIDNLQLTSLSIHGNMHMLKYPIKDGAKFCPGCQRIKPLVEFSKYTNRCNSLLVLCKLCNNSKKRQYRHSLSLLV